MRGRIARAGSFTLSVQWIESDADIDCDSCGCTINGEAYSVTTASVCALVFCRTCAYELRGDLEYAMR